MTTVAPVKERKASAAPGKVASKEAPRLEFISFLRVVAIALVVLGHSLHAFTGGWVYTSSIKSDLFIKLTYFIYTIHMPLLVFISGYLYSFQRLEQAKYSNTADFIKSKGLRLLVPYIVVAFLYMIPIKYLLDLYTLKTLPNVVLRDIILAKDPGHLWFLLMLFNVFVLFRIVEPFIKKESRYLALPLVFGLSLVRYFLPNILQISAALYYLPVFYLGYLIRTSIKEKDFRHAYPFIPVLFGSHVYLYLYNPAIIPIGGDLGSILYRYLLTAIAISWVFLLGSLIMDKFGEKIKGIVRLFDRNAMTTYLLHEEIVFILFALFLDKAHYVLVAGFVFVASVAITVFLGEAVVSRSKLLRFTLGQ